MKIRVQKGKLEKFSCDVLVVNLFEGVKRTGTGSGAVNRALGGLIDRMIKDEGFEGKEGETLVVPVLRKGVKAKKVLLVGLGKQKEFNAEVVRKVSAVAVKKARQLKAGKVGTILHGAGVGGLDPAQAARALTEGSMLGGYAYVKYKSGDDQKQANLPREVVIVDHGDAAKIREIARGIREGEVYADATIFARELVNEPASNMVPKTLADIAVRIVKEAGGAVVQGVPSPQSSPKGRGGSREAPLLAGEGDPTAVGSGEGLSVQILNRAQCEKLGMGAYLGVAKGSDHEPYFIHLVYRPPTLRHSERSEESRTNVRASARDSSASPQNDRFGRIAIVGKGITFDSGGMSLKPAQHMETMKNDMSGCAAMLGVFYALAKLKPNVEVHGISAVCENMPSGRAQKPGDIVRTMSGKTIEVLNTDAEGRLTLADALAYTVKYVKPDALVDLATLTGACIVALGEEVAGAMSNNQELMDKVRAAASSAGEYVWQLPLPEEYKESIKSQVADYVNITPGRKGAGAITAGLLLQEFVGKTPWVHMDIAGPAWAEKEVIPYMPKGGTGFGVRTVLEFLKMENVKLKMKNGC